MRVIGVRPPELTEHRSGTIPAAPGQAGERPARRSLRAQIARLERELSEAFVTAYELGGLELAGGSPCEPRLLIWASSSKSATSWSSASVRRG